MKMTIKQMAAEGCCEVSEGLITERYIDTVCYVCTLITTLCLPALVNITSYHRLYTTYIIVPSPIA